MKIKSLSLSFLCFGLALSLESQSKDASDGYYKLCNVQGCHCPEEIHGKSTKDVLDCTRKYIAKIPSGLHVPDYIHKISFSFNQITTVSPRDFTFVLGTETLDLSHNKIFSLSIGAFSNFEKLKELDLSNNDLKNIGLSVFEGLETLQVLDLGYNRLTTLFPEIFKDVPHLKKLILKINSFETLREDMFVYLNELEDLNLEGTGLSSLPDELFSNNTRLNILNLAGNAFETIPTKALGRLQSLSSIYLNNNPFKVLESGAFPPLQNLHFLFLNNLRDLTEIRQYAFGNLTSLKVIYCALNKNLRTIHKDAFMLPNSKERPKLNLLYLQRNALETISEDLIDWEGAYSVDLTGNPWKCDCRMQWMVRVQHTFLTKIRCASPAEVEGQTIASLGEEHFVCEHDLRKWVFYTLCVFLFLATVVVLGVVLLTLLRYGCLSRMLAADQYKYKRVVSTPVTITVSDTPSGQDVL